MDNLTKEEKRLVELFNNVKYPKDNKFKHLDYFYILIGCQIGVIPFFEILYGMKYGSIEKLSGYLRFKYFECGDAEKDFYAVIKEAIVLKYPKLESMLQHQKP